MARTNGKNGGDRDLLVKMLDALDGLRGDMKALRGDVNDRLDSVNSRLNNVLTIIGGHHRDLEE